MALNSRDQLDPLRSSELPRCTRRDQSSSPRRSFSHGEKCGLAVVGLSLQWRAGAALLKGSVMGLFGLWVAASTIHNAIAADVPKAELMGTIGLLALAA